MVRALLDNDEIVDSAESLPDFSKLRGQKFPEQRADAHVGEIIARSPNHAAPGGIVSVLRMIERQVHEPGKRDRAVRANGLTYQFGQHRIQSENVQRPTSNVQRPMINAEMASPLEPQFDVGRSTLSVERLPRTLPT